MKLVIEPDYCVASGACVLECPEVFAQDEDGVVVLITDSPAEEHHAKVRFAVAACPAAVIRIEE